MTSNIFQLTPTALLVEDDQALRESTAEYLSKIGYVVTAVGDGLHFFQALAAQGYDVAIVDLGLPDMDGMQLLEYMRANTSMPCVILTARDGLEDRVLAYDFGADLYLIKPVDLREVASALGQLMRRVGRNTAQDIASSHWRLNLHNSNLLTPSSITIALSFKELVYLNCLTANPQQPVHRATILAALDYADDFCAHRALESLVRRLRRKIEQVAGTAPIKTCHGVGYSFAAPVIVM